MTDKDKAIKKIRAAQDRMEAWHKHYARGLEMSNDIVTCELARQGLEDINTIRAVLETALKQLEGVCLTCHGDGCVVDVGYTIGCCGNFMPHGECCGNGVQEQVQEQIPCEPCEATGLLHAADKKLIERIISQSE